MAYLIGGLVRALCGAAEAQQGCRNGADGDGHVHPGQEGALIGKEGLGLYPHGSRPAQGFMVRAWGFSSQSVGVQSQSVGIQSQRIDSDYDSHPEWGFAVRV
jgi:hypothetical protein